MSRHSQMFDTTLSITYTEGTKTKSFTIKCTVNSLTDQERGSGGWSVGTVDFTLRYDDIRASEERATKTKDCIIRGYKGKYVKYDGTTINEPFNVYEQDYGFLRRQQNTDPEEGDTTAIGT